MSKASVPAATKRSRCAIYTRKSSEEGLEQEFNSLDAQRDACVLRALGRAWAWRRLENGEAATLRDIARAEKVTDRYVSRIMRLAYLSPDVLERLLLWRVPPSVSVNDLIKASYLPWAEQMGRVFD